VSGITTAVAVDAAGHTAYARLGDGTARCWGSNGYGQAGNGSTASAQLTPVAVGGVSSAISSMRVGRTSSCAVLADDSAVCWGGSAHWPLGTGVEVPALLPEVVGSGEHRTD
jgi:alpha-tubulin suppressor-like RCC1 family protein